MGHKKPSVTGLYDLHSQIILPFRGPIAELTTVKKIFGESWETKWRLYYRPQSDPIPELSTDDRLNTSLCTYVDVSTKLPLNLDTQGAKKWIFENDKRAIKVFEDNILPRINLFLLQIKRTDHRAPITGVLRSVGDIDLIYHDLKFQDELCLRRVISSFVEGVRGEQNNQMNHVDWELPLTTEWKMLVRGEDLVNHGYFNEAFVVGFSLLDKIAQEFITQRLERLSGEQAREFLHTIERSRLKTYLGPLCTILVGSSPLDDKEIEEEMTWINRRRNAIIHDGAECGAADARRALRLIVSVLRILNRHQNYLYPEKLQFWTDRDV